MPASLTPVLLVVRCRLRLEARLRAETLVLRQEVLTPSRQSPERVRLRNLDRLILPWLYRSFHFDPKCDNHGQAGNRSVGIAPLPTLLALEVSAAHRPTKDRD